MRSWLAAWLLSGCVTEPAVDDVACDGAGARRVLVVRDIRFVRATDGVSDGFDLDGSGAADSACGPADYIGPNGQLGIDNAFAGLLPALELTEARTMEDIIAASVRSGELLILVELADLDDDRNDACVDVALRRGQGEPLLGNDGEILPSQTFAEMDGADASVVTGVPLEGGSASAGPVTLALPVNIFEYQYDFSLLDGRVRVDLDGRGRATGVLGGGLPLDVLLQVASNPDVDPTLLPLIEGLLGQAADLAPDEDGTCTRLSMAFQFEAVEAFLAE
jgi:hypothetical protein